MRREGRLVRFVHLVGRVCLVDLLDGLGFKGVIRAEAGDVVGRWVVAEQKPECPVVGAFTRNGQPIATCLCRSVADLGPVGVECRPVNRHVDQRVGLKHVLGGDVQRDVEHALFVQWKRPNTSKVDENRAKRSLSGGAGAYGLRQRIVVLTVKLEGEEHFTQGFNRSQIGKAVQIDGRMTRLVGCGFNRVVVVIVVNEKGERGVRNGCAVLMEMSNSVQSLGSSEEKRVVLIAGEVGVLNVDGGGQFRVVGRKTGPKAVTLVEALP